MPESQTKHSCEVLIIGAGIAGLFAAHALRKQQVSVMVIDREERVGGRIVTEHIGGGWADTGAQFFTVREAAFQAYVDTWLAEGLVFEWTRGFARGSRLETDDDGFPRYAAYAGLTAVPRRLAQGLVVHKAVAAQRLAVHDNGWQVFTQADDVYHSQALLLAMPVPQSLKLFNNSNLDLATADQAALAQITYAPNITAVFTIDGAANLPPVGAVQHPNDHLGWICDNQRKGISPEATTLTLQVTPAFSQLWWLAPPAELAGALRREAGPFLAKGTTIRELHLHRWPYALPTSLHPERTLVAQELPPLAFAGDAFNGPRVEGAALSGLAAAAAILPLLKR